MRQVQGLSMPTRFSSSLLALFLFVSVAAEAAPGSPAECADRCCAQSALGEVCAADCQLQCEKTGLTDPIAVALGDAPAPAGDPPALKPGMLQPGWQPIAEQAMGDIRTGVMQAHPDASRATALGDDNGTVRTAIYAFVMAAGSAKPAADTAQGAEDSLVDAFWQSSIGPQTSEANGTERITRAYTFANAITQLSHSVYGGPPGAAAYAAWWAYQQPDTSPAQALRIGLLVGAGLWASERHGDGQPVAVAEVQRSSLAAALGGVTVAAAGGDEQALRRVFFDTGAAVLVQDGTQLYCLSATRECQQPPSQAARYEGGRFVGWALEQLPAGPANSGAAFPDAGNAPTAPLPNSDGALRIAQGWALNWQAPKDLGNGVLYPLAVLKRGADKALPVVASNPAVAQPSRALGAVAAPAGAAVEVPAAAPAPMVANAKGVAKAQVQVPASVQAQPESPVPATAPAPAQPQSPAPGSAPEAPAAATLSISRYLCERGGASRSIWVIPGDPKAGYVCRTMYQIGNTQAVLWNAKQNPNICTAKAQTQVDKEKSQGYQCRAVDEQGAAR
jgi:hypothetical protein